MANVQNYFEQFHGRIRADYEMSATLRDKRDIILEKIRKDLEKKKRPGFSEVLQGSFAIKTGVIPIGSLNYDIDVALRFRVSEKDYSPKDLHVWIYEAVQDHTDDVQRRGPCVRVVYSDGYHVDLVPYSWNTSTGHDQYKLAHEKDGWLDADPIVLLDHIKGVMAAYKDTEDASTKTNQFRRCTRYLRRWDDQAIPRPSKAKPTGLGFVLLLEKYLKPTTSFDGSSDDRKALERFAQAAASVLGRLTAVKPTPEYEDVLKRLNDDDMNEFKKRLTNLATKLSAADSETDPVKACTLLQSVFGKDFPIPNPEETAKKTGAPAIITSSTSA